MAELWLKFDDVDGTARRVHVAGQKFTVGRHSANNLSIVDGRLSREHLSIDRFGDVFVVSDSGSSNGTKLNGLRLTQPAALKQDDRLDLGGFPIETEFEGFEVVPRNDGTAASISNETPAVAAAAASAPNGRSGSIPTIVFIITPVFGILIVALVVGIFLLTRGTPQPGPSSDEFQYSDELYERSPATAKEKNALAPAERDGEAAAVANTFNSAVTAADQPAAAAGLGEKLSDSAKVEQNGRMFLRKIAQNDPTAFLTSEQSLKVAARVKQLSGNSAIAANISSARQNAAQIKSLSAATNLKPQFLAAAAIAKLGSTRGDVVATARSMTDTLDKLRTHLGSELADDALLMIAAYEQGQAGEHMRLRNILQDLAMKSPESARAIRTIWFLHKNGKITQAEFDSAVTFLAVGTITQNPKDFGVNAEALTF